MSPETIRSIAFGAGLVAFLVWEWLAPHHVRSIPRLRRWIVNLSLSGINATASALAEQAVRRKPPGVS